MPKRLVLEQGLIFLKPPWPQPVPHELTTLATPSTNQRWATEWSIELSQSPDNLALKASSPLPRYLNLPDE